MNVLPFQRNFKKQVQLINIAYSIQQFRMKGISNRGGCKCRQHEFSLKPLTKDLHYSRKVEVFMCECDKTRQKKKISKIRQQRTTAYPVFNHDDNYATPAFILQSQKEHFEQNRQIYLKDHIRKVRQYDEISENLYLPAPRSNNDYCNVCCCSYSNYIEHITGDDHHKQIKKSKFNSHILEIEQLFQNNYSENSMKRSIQNRSILIDQDSSCGMFGYKKVKTDEKTEVSSRKNRQQIVIGDELMMKQYQTYCQLNHMLIYEHQQNMLEKRNQRPLFPSYNQFYTPPQLIIQSNFQLMEYYRHCCCYWQSLCQLRQQQSQFAFNNHYSIQGFLDNVIYCTNLSSMAPTQTNSIQNQLLYYYPSCLPSIEAAQ